MFQRLKTKWTTGIFVTVLSVLCVMSSTYTGSAADQTVPTPNCSYETSEARIIEKLTQDDVYTVLEGADLDLFIKNANDLYNIGWIRDQIAKVWVIDAQYKSDNPKFQPVHLFFIGNDGCIRYYQTTYKVVVSLLLSPDPQSVLHGDTNSVHPGPGTIVISGIDTGGNIGTYSMWYERAVQGGIKFIVDGQCISACAMILGIVPRDNVCLTDRAAFGLHMAISGETGRPDEDITIQMVRLFYPKWLQDMIVEKGGLRADKLMWLYPEDLTAQYKMCNEEDTPVG